LVAGFVGEQGGATQVVGVETRKRSLPLTRVAETNKKRAMLNGGTRLAAKC